MYVAKLGATFTSDLIGGWMDPSCDELFYFMTSAGFMQRIFSGCRDAALRCYWGG